MTDHDEAARLRREIRERMDRLDELDGAPTNREEALRMAREEPGRFNDLLDAGAIDGSVLGGKEDR